MDPGFLQFISTAAGTTGLAAFAIYLLNQARKDIQALVAQYAATSREDKQLLIKALDDSAKAQIQMSAKVDAMLALITKVEERTNERRTRTSS